MMENSTTEETLINHVSDTALWIAGYRAQETDRLEPAFRDPFAKSLAGERGMKMVELTPHTEAMAFAMVMRTAAIDKLVAKAVYEYGVDAVVNLGAGLDTRPYRMKLPATLDWTEVDFPEMISYKSKLLQNEKPVCRIERIPFDLADRNGRKTLFKDIAKKSKNILVITEGVIGYIETAEAADLADDLYATEGFNFWIQDVSAGRLRRNRHTKDLSVMVRQAPIKFSHPNAVALFGEHGWKLKDRIAILDQAAEVGRKMPMMFPWSLLLKLFPKKMKELGNKTYFYVMLSR